jgi:hypothetical protein
MKARLEEKDGKITLLEDEVMNAITVLFFFLFPLSLLV